MVFKIALFGNPNCGKTTLFNSLTGASQTVGNWPGVTVEKKEGFLKGKDNVKVVDLPGIYSLTPYTNEEIVSRNFLLFEKPDMILNVVSGINLERSLYLTLQLLEFKIPVVVVVSMMDKVRKNGNEIDFAKLCKNLNCDVLEISSVNFNENLEKIESVLKKVKGRENCRQPVKYSEKFEGYLERLQSALKYSENDALKLRFKAIEFFEEYEKTKNYGDFEKKELVSIDSILQNAKDFYEEDLKEILINERYAKIEEIVENCSYFVKGAYDLSDKIDFFITNKFLSIPIFVLILGTIYYFCINLFGKFMAHGLEIFLSGSVNPFFERTFTYFGVASWLKSLVLDGILAGVGTVLTFVPQIFLLFLFLSILEDCGYMARIAFILDRIFLKFGLCGKSVISFLLSCGCGVNGIMSTKTIKNENVGILTTLTTTFVPCNAKLPIIAVICSHIFGGSFFSVFLVYFLCVFAIFIVSLLLKKFSIFHSSGSNFIMELSPYVLPNFKNIFYYTLINVKSFVVKVGTVIFLASILIWFFLNFGFSSNGLTFVSQEKSILAQIGKILSPIFAPVGFGKWEAVVATLSGIFAKENLVNTFGVILNSSQDLKEGFNLKGVFSGDFAAFSFLIFNMLCAPCLVAISTIFKQTLQLKLTLKILFIQTICAYLTSFFIYQVFGFVFGEVSFSLQTVLAFSCLILVLFFILIPGRKIEKNNV